MVQYNYGLFQIEIVMSKPFVPFDEQRRLAEVRKLNILDSPREVCFENITRLIQNIFKVDIVAISIIDKDRQWFKSIRGLNASEMPRELSFCAKAIYDTCLVVVPDTKLDEKYQNSPLVTDKPNIRFYASCPLFSKNDYGIGTVCIADRKPRKFSNNDQEILFGFGKIVEDMINNHTFKCQNKALNQEFTKLKHSFRRDTDSTLLSKNDFLEYFNYIQSHYKTLDKFNKQPYDNFCLTILKIKNFDKLILKMDDNEKRSSIKECILDQIIKHLNGNDIITNLDANDFILIIEDTNEHHAKTLCHNICESLHNLNLKQYGINSKLKVEFGYTLRDHIRKYSIDRLIDLAYKDLEHKHAANQ